MLANPKNNDEAKLPGLNKKMLNEINEILGRTPNSLELKVFTALWSPEIETSLIRAKFAKKPSHKFFDLTNEISCILKTRTAVLNTESNIYAESMKIISRLSNNILRNSAKPVACLNSFKLETTRPDTTRIILNDLIKGTSEISNATGIPTLRADAIFTACNKNTQLIQSVSIGLIDKKLTHSKQINLEIGNNVYLLGKLDNFEATGINKKKKRSGTLNKNISAYYQKIFHDAVLELIQLNAVKKMEVVEEGGILTSCLKLLEDTNLGVTLNIPDQLNTSEDNWIHTEFQPATVLVSCNENDLLKTAEKWELNCVCIGKLTEIAQLKIVNNSNLLAEIPIAVLLNEEPAQQQVYTDVSENNQFEQLDINEIPFPKKLREVAWFLMEHPNIASRQCIDEQYDSMAGTANMSTNFPTDSQVLNLKGSNKAIAIDLYNNSQFINTHPEIGAQIAIANLARRMACTGAKPIGITASLSPTNNCDSINYAQFVKGLEKATQKFKIDFNIENCKQSYKKPDNTPENSVCLNANIAMLGLIEDKNHQMTISFKNKGNTIFLIGQSKEDIACSEYLVSYHKIKNEYLPDFNLEMEYKIQRAMQELISKNLVCSAHSISKGGLFVALVESAMVFRLGFDIITDTDIRTDAFLFGESQGRIIVSITPNKEDKFIDFMMKKEIPFLALGHVTKGEMRIDDISFGFINDAKRDYKNSFSKLINS